MSLGQFYTEMERRDAELEEARQTYLASGRSADDSEAWNAVKVDYAEWRMGIKALAGRRGWVKAHRILHGDEATNAVLAKEGLPALSDPVWTPEFLDLGIAQHRGEAPVTVEGQAEAGAATAGGNA